MRLVPSIILLFSLSAPVAVVAHALPTEWSTLLDREERLESELLRLRFKARADQAEFEGGKGGGIVAHEAAERALNGKLLGLRFKLLLALQTVAPREGTIAQRAKQVQLKAEHQIRISKLALEQLRRMWNEVSLRIRDQASRTEEVHSLHTQQTSLRKQITELQTRELTSEILQRSVFAHKEALALLKRRESAPIRRVVQKLAENIEKEKIWLERDRSRELQELRIALSQVQELLLGEEDRDLWYLQDQEWLAYTQEHNISFWEDLGKRRRYLVDLMRAVEKTSCVEFLQ